MIIDYLLDSRFRGNDNLISISTGGQHEEHTVLRSPIGRSKLNSAEPKVEMLFMSRMAGRRD
jgi:hypothetical protein